MTHINESFRHPTLSDKFNAPKLLTGLNFQLDATQNLDSLLAAHMPGNLDQFIGIMAMIISSSNSDAVRLVAKHHPCVSFYIISDNPCIMPFY